MTDEPDCSDNLGLSVRLGTDSLVAFGGYLFTLVVGLPLQIYIARVLGSELLGIFGLLDAAVTTIAGLVGLGIAQTLIRFLPVHLERKEYQCVRALVRHGALVLLATGSAAYGLVLVGVLSTGYFWQAALPYKVEALTMGLMVPLNLLVTFSVQTLRGFHDIRYMVIGNSIVQLSVKAIATVIFLSLGFALAGYVLSTVLAAVCAIAWMGFGLMRKINALPRCGRSHESTVSHEWMSYAKVNYLLSLTNTATANLDRYLLGYFVGPGAVGILVVIRQLQTLPSVFNQMLLLVGTPMFSAAHAKNDTVEQQHLYHLITDWAFRAAFPLVAVLCIFANPILSLYGPAFATGGEVACIIFILSIFAGMVVGPVGQLVWMSGLEKIGFRWALYLAILTCLTLLLLIPLFGVVGAGISLALGTAFINGRLLLLIRDRLNIHWQSKRFNDWVAPATLTLLACIGLRAVGWGHGAIELGITVVGAYLVFLAINIGLGLHDEEKQVFRHLLRRGNVA